MNEKVRELKNSLGLSLKDMSDATGYSSANISYIINDKQKASETFLKTLVKAYDLSDDYFGDLPKDLVTISALSDKTELILIKSQVIERMKKLEAYKPEFEDAITIYSDLLYQYKIKTREYSQLGYPTETDDGKRPIIVITLETLRKDILAYSNILLLNPKMQSDKPKEKQSKLGEALRLINEG